jgi:hypothetical protein
VPTLDVPLLVVYFLTRPTDEVGEMRRYLSVLLVLLAGCGSHAKPTEREVLTEYVGTYCHELKQTPPFRLQAIDYFVNKKGTEGYCRGVVQGTNEGYATIVIRHTAKCEFTHTLHYWYPLGKPSVKPGTTERRKVC